MWRPPFATSDKCLCTLLCCSSGTLTILQINNIKPTKLMVLYPNILCLIANQQNPYKAVEARAYH